MTLRQAGLALAGLLLPGLLAAGDPDPAVVADPRLLSLPDRHLQKRWRSLFDDDPPWVSRQVSYLAWRQPAQLATIFAARLLYGGDAWTDRPGESTSSRRWRLADRDVRAAILREIRWRRDPAWRPTLEAFLAWGSGRRPEDLDPGLIMAAIGTLWLIDQRAVEPLLLRLADPRRPDALPGSALVSVRSRSLAMLADLVGPGSPSTLTAFDWALQRQGGAERSHAISLIPRGSLPEVLAPAIRRMADELRQEKLDASGRDGLVLALTRIGGRVDRDLAATLAWLAAVGDRAVAVAAATALAGGVSWDAGVDPEPLAARAANPEAEPVIRHALLNLLLRIKPSLIAGSDPASQPWKALADHRTRLAAWEWEQYAR